MLGIFIRDMEIPRKEGVAIFVYPDGKAKVWRPHSMVGQVYDVVPVSASSDLIERDAVRNECDALEPYVWLEDVAGIPAVIKV